MIDSKKLGKICQRFRREQGYSQTQVGDALHYSHENISSFERGLNDNSQILLWYIYHGLTKEHLFKGGDE